MNPRTLILVGALLIVLGVLSWLAPDGTDERPDLVTVAQAADASYDAGDYKAASMHYRQAYALLDPLDTEATPRRAVLAVKAARALVGWALAVGPEEDFGESILWTADRWLDTAIDLDERAGWTHYERAILFDAEKSPLRDPQRALNAYRAFLGWARTGDHQAEPNPPDLGGPQVARAQKRIPELEEALRSPR